MDDSMVLPKILDESKDTADSPNPTYDALGDQSTPGFDKVEEKLELPKHAIETSDDAIDNDTTEARTEMEVFCLGQNMKGGEQVLKNQYLSGEDFQNYNKSDKGVSVNGNHLEVNGSMHNNMDNNYNENESSVMPRQEKHNLKAHHLNDSGIDINDIEIENILETQMHSKDKSINNEDLYDETTPKRIPKPNKLKIPIPTEGSQLVMDSIDTLISPDDNGPVKRSPYRIRRLASVERPQYENPVKGRPITVYNEPEENVSNERTAECGGQVMDHNRQQHVEPQLNRTSDSHRLQIPNEEGYQDHGHYKKSPETRRKFCSADLDATRRSESPVLRLKNRSESSNVCRKYGRKISSEARLGGDTSEAVNKRTPIRKISSNARLEHAGDPSLYRVEEEPRCRRVSFGTATYIASAPKTDNKAFAENLMTNKRQSNDIPANIKQTGKISKDNVRTLNASHQQHKEQETEVDTKDNVKNSTTNVRLHQQKTISGEQYDNKGYIDDETVLKPQNQPVALKMIDVQTGTPLKVRKNNISNDLSSSTDSLISLEADKSLETITKIKKLSTHSLPAKPTHEKTKKMGRHSVAANGYSPKSILKVRNADLETKVSTESITGKSSTAKRDSIALYHEHMGDDAMDVEKQYHGSWVGISRKDFKRLWDSRYDILARYKVHIAVFTVFTLTLLFVVIGVELHKPKKTEVKSEETLIFDPDYRRIHLFDDDELDEVVGTLGMEIPEAVPASNCYLNFEDEQEMKCLSWEEYAELTIVHKTYNKTQCYDVRWILNPGVRLSDCYDTEGAYWYGPTNLSEIHWPIKPFPFSFDSMIPSKKGTFSTVVEYMWLSSRGVAIVIDPDYPVHVSWNERSKNSFCISRSLQESSYPGLLDSSKRLRYSICNGVNIVETYKFVRKNFFPRLTYLPDLSLLSSPYWSTLSEAESFSTNQTAIMTLAKNIMTHKFNCSNVEIDAQWERKYGDFMFNSDNFTDFDSMLKLLTTADCGFSVSIYPFVNYLSENFKEGLNNGYFVKSPTGNAPNLIQWEHGVGAMIDITNPDSRDWLGSKLIKLRTTYNVSTIRFGYGKVLRLPSNEEFHMEKLLPDKIMKTYTSFVAAFSPVTLERTSHTQNIPSLISIPSEIIKTKEHKCLKNIIPKLLSVGLLGYPFLRLDGFDLQHIEVTNNGEFPSKDLFIRWMQLSSVLPAVKYTVKPWHYDEEVIMISKNFTKFHQDTVIETINDMKEDILAGEPILRPLWWADPNDETVFTIDDQFLLGDNIIVAPILCEGESGVAERNIYFPRGIWRDSLSKALIPGPKWIRYYHINQNQMAIFTREALYESAL